MARPTAFLIGSYRYVIKWSNKKTELKTGDSTVGVSYAGQQKVFMRDDAGHQVERETLVHEALHCMILQALPTEFGEKQEERVVAGLAPRILDFILLNPDVMTYLQEPE